MTSSSNWPDAVQAARKLTNNKRNLINRTQYASIRLTLGEKAMLDRMAAKHGQTISSFVRDAALDVARALIEYDGEEPEA